MEDIGISVPTLVAQLINFGILLLLLYFVLYKPVIRMLNERSNRIKASMEQAEEIEQKMAETEERVREQLEAARWTPYLKPDGIAIVADVVLVPLTTTESNIPYPNWDVTRGILSQYTDQIYLVPATFIAQELGNPRALNMVLLGFLSAFLGIEIATWGESIRRKLSPQFMDSSLKAFSRGAAEAGKIARVGKEV